MSDDAVAALRRFRSGSDGYRWEGVELRDYKDAGAAPFRDVTRQTLFSRADLAGELRYFEIAPGGHSTLERHRHVHAVLILQGRGTALVGEEVFPVAPFDLVTIAPVTWHQFRAAVESPLGFLCMVDASRDRPELPDAAELARLRADPALAAFLR